jgi:hypothetical protein
VDTEDIHPGDGETADEVDFDVEAARLPRGQTELTVRQDGALRHKDVFNLNREDDRRKFRNIVAKKLGVDPVQVETRLLAVMQELEDQGGEVEDGAAGADEEEGKAGSDAQVLLALGDTADLFHTTDGKAFATVPVNGHPETFWLRSPSLRQWLVREFRREKNRPPSMDALAQALLALEAQAQLDGPTREVHIRVAEVVDPDDLDNPAVYIDLADTERRAVRVTRQGWEVIDDPPVRFRRPRGMHPLPVPQTGGSLDDLRRFVNLPGKRRWRRFLAWLLAALRGRGPYPLLVVSGEQGSAKSALMQVARLLIDPHEIVDRSIPRDIRDLSIAANNSMVLSFDNVSFLPDWFSDALCRLSTGAAFATRELYSDSDEALFRAKRPVILTGIPDIATQGDLLDRSVLEHLPSIPEHKRKVETKFWNEFYACRPRLLGALLDCLVGGLNLAPEITESKLPRMADFALWGEAVCRATGEPAGAFLRSFRSNLREAAEIALDSSVVAGPIQALVGEGPWTGEAQELMSMLPALADPDGTGAGRGRSWPHTPRAMSGALRRIVPALRVHGITIEFHRGKDHGKKRLITIRREGQTASDKSPPTDPP